MVSSVAFARRRDWPMDPCFIFILLHTRDRCEACSAPYIYVHLYLISRGGCHVRALCIVKRRSHTTVELRPFSFEGRQQLHHVLNHGSVIISRDLPPEYDNRKCANFGVFYARARARKLFVLPTLVPFGKYLVSMLLPALFTITSTVFYVRRD